VLPLALPLLAKLLPKDLLPLLLNPLQLKFPLCLNNLKVPVSLDKWPLLLVVLL
jgi:hypothetical protein